MSHTNWRPKSPLSGLAAVTTVAEGEATSVRLDELSLRACYFVIAGRGKSDAVQCRMINLIGLAPPSNPRAVSKGTVVAIWAGPDRWSVLCDAKDGDALLTKLEIALEGFASCIDQTDANVSLRLSGVSAPQALMKLVGVDVDTREFPIDAVALTPVVHIPSLLWRQPDREGAPVFDILSPRSTAINLWDAIVVAASEFGLETHPLEAQILNSGQP